MRPFVRSAANPVLTADPAHSWESTAVFNPAAIVRGGRVYLLYRAQGTDLISRVGLAYSDDGVHFERLAEPVLAPSTSYDTNGCEDPRLVEVAGTYYLTYTSYDGESARLSLATSRDLRSWTKYGPIFPDFVTPGNTKPWSKSGAILTTPIDGTYYMYFGDNGIFSATSSDLIHWTPSAVAVVPQEPNDFTARLVEAGPPPVITPDGLILLFHNAAEPYETALKYSPGQVLIDPSDPTVALARMTQPFLTPEASYELEGQTPNTIFIEGLVEHRGALYLYYGAADTSVALAVHEP